MVWHTNVNYVIRLIMPRFSSLLMPHYACMMRTLIINANGGAAYAAIVLSGIYCIQTLFGFIIYSGLHCTR